jgi:methyltransferase
VTTATFLFLAFLILQRLGELIIARRNTARLLADGAHEVGAGHYPVMVAMHAAWLAAILLLGWDEAVRPFWLILYVLLQGFRIWILGTLGRRWTTRIIVTDAPLVSTGPFKFIPHPNYALVVAEIIVAPLVLGLWGVAIVFTLLNALMLRHRIKVEDAAIRPAG